MSSDVSIVNQALSQLGEQSITSLDDDTPTAKIAKLIYAPTRDSMIQSHNWTFATRWYDLPKMANPPLCSYTNVFPLPPEVDRVIFAGTSNDQNYPIEYAIDCAGVTTNSDTCVVQTIVQVTDPQAFSKLFTQALVARLAAEMCIAVTGSRTLYENLLNVANIKSREAVNRDQLQGTSKRIRSKWLLRTRHGGANVAGPTV